MKVADDLDTDPVNGSWLALNARTAGERSITMAMFIMAANCSGIVGSQLFQSSDAPYYPVAWTAIICMTSAAIVFCIIANLQYRILNRRRSQEDTGGEYDVGRFEYKY